MYPTAWTADVVQSITCVELKDLSLWDALRARGLSPSYGPVDVLANPARVFVVCGGWFGKSNLCAALKWLYDATVLLGGRTRAGV